MLLNWYRGLRLRHRYPTCNIATHLVSPTACLGVGITLGHGVSVGANVEIGDHTYVNPYTDIASGTIGRFCSIASHCIIGPDNHPVDWLSTSPRVLAMLQLGDLYQEEDPPPVIGHDVWIGSQVVIKRGVRIGDGAIVGSGAVVTRDVGPYSIVVGMPAKHIRFRFDAKTIEQLLAIRWWDQWESLEHLRRVLATKELFPQSLELLQRPDGWD